MDPIDEIKQIYFKVTAKSIDEDFARAIDLLKQLPDEDTRARVAVYMEGLAEMRTDWEQRQKQNGPRKPGKKTPGAKGKAGKFGKQAKAGQPAKTTKD
jgi:hypothetical protein